MFLSLFNYFVGCSPVEIILLHDTRVCRAFTPSYAGFKSFASPVSKSRVVCYDSLDFCKRFFLRPVFLPNIDDAIFIRVFTLEGCFHSASPCFCIGNIYSQALEHPSPSHRVSPAGVLENRDIPSLVAGEFNIHTPASEPLRIV